MFLGLFLWFLIFRVNNKSSLVRFPLRVKALSTPSKFNFHSFFSVQFSLQNCCTSLKRMYEKNDAAVFQKDVCTGSVCSKNCFQI